jgi:hypothetical protein
MTLKDNHNLSYKNVQLEVETGDITQVTSDALITLINSGRMWFGGVDGAITRAVGGGFHQAALNYLDLHPKATDGTTIFVDGSDILVSRSFQNVIFVIDDLAISLERLVEAALIVAFEKDLTIVTLPLMRSGVMVGVVEKTLEEVADNMMLGIRGAADAMPDAALTVKIVVYADPDGPTRAMLRAAAEKIFAV